MRRKIIMAAAMAVLLASSSGCSRNAMTGVQGQSTKDTVPAGPGSYVESTTAAPPYIPIGEPVLDTQVDPDAPKGVAETMRVGTKVTWLNDITSIDPEAIYSVVVWYSGDYHEAYIEDYNRNYEEYGSSYNELTELSRTQDLSEEQIEALNAIALDIGAKIKAEQEAWLEVVGAQDIKEIGGLNYCLTMKGEDIHKLDTGKCKLTASFRPYGEGLPLELSEYYGTYYPCGQVFKSLFSSWAGVTSMQNATVELNENGITITESSADGGAVYERTYHIDTTCTYENCFGFNSLDIIYMPVELSKAVTDGSALIRLDDGKRILLSGGRLYMDCGTQGLYEFAPAK